MDDTRIEPSNEILEMALDEALTMTPKSYYLLKLKELRNHRYTWVGKYENELRIFIDKVLSGRYEIEEFKFSHPELLTEKLLKEISK